MLRTERYKLVHHVDRGFVQLFSIGDEHTDLMPSQPEQARCMLERYQRLPGTLRTLGSDNTQGEAFDPATRAMLEALGYVGPSDERSPSPDHPVSNP